MSEASAARPEDADSLKRSPPGIPNVTRTPAGLLMPAVAVLLVTLVVVAIVGAWPPFVAVESGSMAPEVERGDLVVVTSTDRFPWGGLVGSDDPGAPTRLGDTGDVAVFSPPESEGRPILHRIAFSVSEGEDWTERADPALIDGSCAELSTCPAPHDGYVTYGDANGEYDQSAGIAPVVRTEWIHAKALFSVPYLGWFRVGVDAAVVRLGPVPTALGVGGIAAMFGGVGAVLFGRLRRRARPKRNE